MIIVLIHNDGTGTDKSANYTYEVRVNQKIIETGNIKGHNCKDGWKVLLHELTDCRQTLWHK
jgi:hypothetical protein